MGAAQNLSAPTFNYTSSPTGPGNWLSDTLLGTNTMNNEFNWDAMNYQNQFNEFMSDTQYQRSVADMLKAGINPTIMFAQNGGSAKNSAPTSAGVASSQANPSGSVLGSMLGNVVKSFGNAIGLGSDKAGAAKLLGDLL